MQSFFGPELALNDQSDHNRQHNVGILNVKEVGKM